MEGREGKGGRQRLFVALDLPDAIRDDIAAWGEAELIDPALRAARRESLHVTLAFLGGRGPDEAAAIAALVRGFEAPGAPLRLEDPVPLPRRGRPSALALPAPSPATADLHRGLAERLVAAGLYEPEKRDFWPHVTVARVRTEGRGARRPEAVARWPGDLPKALKEPFYGVRVTLYRSELQPGGARYVPLAQVELS
ncbi:MAG: RNA 2',3'-cyclic phosphodiesterase [Actinobacteria bacterium]|nr:RNA 2',3'-cyclic phosphodiesterase [Actinomycetota bacterium]